MFTVKPAEQLLKQFAVLCLVILLVDERVETQTQLPADLLQLQHCLQAPFNRGHSVLQCLVYFFGGKAECNDGVCQRCLLQQAADLRAFGAQLDVRQWAVAEERQEILYEGRYRFHRQTVTVVAREEPAGFTAGGCQNRVDVSPEVFIVYIQYIVCRAVHALQETVAAVIQAIQHMGKIPVAAAAKTVSIRCLQYAALVLACQDQGRFALLQAEIL